MKQMMKHKVALLVMFAFLTGIISLATTKQVEASNAPIARNLKLNTSYYNYDITGDGMADRFRLYPRYRIDNYTYKGLRIQVNGISYEFPWAYSDDYFESASYDIVTLANGKVFVFLNVYLDEDDICQSLYQYINGRFYLALDFVAPISFTLHPETSIVDVRDNTITIKQSTQLPRIAYADLVYSYNYANGNFARTSNVAKIASYSYAPSYLKVKKSVTWYKNKECKKKKGTLKKSTYAKPVELYIGKKNISIKIKTKSGKTGWVKGPKRIKSSELIFQKVGFAG